jgi:hypothetical protein
VAGVNIDTIELSCKKHLFADPSRFFANHGEGLSIPDYLWTPTILPETSMLIN